MWYPIVMALLVVFLGCSCVGSQQPARPKKPGVADPSVRIPIEKLVPEAVFEVPGAPDWIAVDADVWISNAPKDNVVRLDPKTNHVRATIPVGKNPNSGLAAGFGSVWVPNCGDATLSRIDLLSGKVTTTYPMKFADSEGGIAVGAGSVWVMTDNSSTLARIDPATDKVIAEIKLAPGSCTVAFGDAAVFVTSTKESLLTRVDPMKNAIVTTIKVGPSPRFLAVGEGSVWTLNQGDGSVTRVDLKTNMVVATIEAGIPGGGGEIAVGEGSVWATSSQYPITRIDPATNRVAQQFHGKGGDAIRVGHGSVWLSNLRGQTVWRLDPRKIEATRPD